MNDHRNICNFKMGDFVQQSENSQMDPFVGTVVGISANVFGEILLMVEMIIRTSPNYSTELYENSGYQRVMPTCHDLWKYTGALHPSNVAWFHNENNLVRVT
jgi:hypothetical protein